MTPAALAKIIEGLPSAAPLTSELVSRYWPKKAERDQQEHWLTWLAHHNERGTRNVVRVYFNCQSPPMILWINEATGILKSQPQADVIVRNIAGLPVYRQCSMIRRQLLWTPLRERLLTLNGASPND
jgi:hypothetical protein